MPRLGAGLGLPRVRPTGFTGLLDTYGGAAAAYSLRPLRRSWVAGDVILARRSSDNAELGFTANEITNGTLTAWAGAGDAFVKTWYDQSGNAIDFTQTTAANQPQIVSSGALVALNGKPAFNTDATDNFTFTATSIAGFVSYVGRVTNTGTFKALLGQGSAGTGGLIFTDGTSADPKWSLRRAADATVTIDSAVSATTQAAVGFDTVQNSMEFFINGSSAGTDTTTNAFSVTADYFLPTVVSKATTQTQELIIWNTDQNANAGAIATNQTAHYGI